MSSLQTIECGANGSQGCIFGPHGPNGERQCEYCGAPPVEVAPIDMLLYCPNCGVQHIDAPETLPMAYAIGAAHFSEGYKPWTNPPHRSHLCANPECGCIWRPADVPTNGVDAIRTEGKADTWPMPHNEEVRAALAQRCAVWASYGVDDSMLHPEQSDLVGGETDCAPVLRIEMTHTTREHDLYTDNDADRPMIICDGNGQVVLDLCKRCGKAEAELIGTTCQTVLLVNEGAKS